ncbi:hypothetical protein Tco_0414196 [Tanacetum coccineum]
MEISMSSLDRSSTTISDLYKGLDVITQLLKDINNAIKDDPAANQKINEATKTFAKISSNITEVLSLVRAFDFSALMTTVKSFQAHAFKQDEASASWMKSSTNMACNLGSRMNGVELSQKALKQDISSLNYYDKEEQIKKAEEEARLNAIIKPEVIKVIREEAKKLGINLKDAITTKAGELKHKYDSYMWTISSRLKPEPITDIKIHPKTKLVVITVYKGTDGINFDVHKPFLFGAFGIFELDELREIIPKKKNTVNLSIEFSSLTNLVINLSKDGVTRQSGDGSSCVASMVKSPENVRFSMKLRKLIAEHPDQEKLKSKKVKLEALRYNMD